jgi:hypothetical protein
LQEQVELRRAIWEDVQQDYVDFLADESVLDEAKVPLLDRANVNDEVLQQGINSTLEVLAQQAAIAPSTVSETEAAEESRFSALDSIKSVNEYKRRMQSVVNSVRQSNDSTKVGEVVDVAELLMPFAEWIHYDNLQRDLVDGDANWRLMGTQKKAIFDSLKSMPIEKREELTQSIINILNENENVLLPDGNDLLILDSLEKMLINNDYSNGEKWFDNIVSLLDITGVGGILVDSFRLARRGAKAKETARSLAKEAENFKASEVATDSQLAEEASTFVPEVSPAEKAMSEKLEKLVEDFVPTADPTPDEVFREGVAHATRTEVDPTSPSQVIKDVNPEEARKIHSIVNDTELGDEAAEALYGTSRTEALAKDLLPEPGTNPSISHKVEMRKPRNEEPEALRDARRRDGNTIISDSEMQTVNNRLVAGLENVEGMFLHGSSMSVRTNLDGTLGISAMYSPTDNGFSNASLALDNAEYAFRNYGIPRDNFKVVVKQGDEWVEVSEKDAKAVQSLKDSGVKFEDSQYGIKLDYDYKFRPEDLTSADLLTTSGGIVNRIVGLVDNNPLSNAAARLGQGSVSQNIFDPSSILHPQLVNAASVAVDRSYGLQKLYVDLFEDFSTKYAKMPKDRRTLMTDYIHEANLEGLQLDVTNLYARGFSSDEIEMLKEWRKANDAMWYAANDDMVKTLRAKGFKAFVHKDSDTYLIGQPTNMGSIPGRTRIYDASADVNINMTSARGKEWSEMGAQVIKLDEPVEIKGEFVDHVISYETPEKGYLRSLQDNEIVLNYRDGYYPVMYDANYFIERKIKMPDGSVKKKVVASAKDKGEIKNFKAQIRETERLSEDEYNEMFTFRRDRRSAQERQHTFEQGSWSLAANSGLSAQKVRGQRLLDAGVDLHKRGYAHLKDPLEAVANQIRQVSQRVSMRDYVESYRKRWMLNYGKYIDLPINSRTGKIDYPSSLDQIKGKDGAPKNMVRDARTQFNYLYSLENGFINGMDEVFRGVVHLAAEVMSNVGIRKAERLLLDVENFSPVQGAKTAAFKLYISSAPARQALIQRGQIPMLNVINPKYVNTSMVKDLWMINQVRAGLSKNPRYVKLFEEVKEAGIMEAVDHHNLIRTDLLKLADVSATEKLTTAAGKPLKVLQKVGFDLAEQDVLLSAWLAHRDLAIKAGKNVKNQRVKDEILGKTRAFTLNMNRSGEMAYSQNTLGLISQFFSFRHKALLQPLTNKSLTPLKKAQLLGFTTALYGVEATAIYYFVDSLFDGDEPNEVKDALKDGFVDVTLNGVLSALSGEDQNIDWGDLAPSEAYGMGNVLSAMWTTNVGEMIANAPAGSLLFGRNPRLQDAFKSGLRFFYPPNDYDDPMLETKFSDVVLASANLFSGFSAAWKANYAFNTGKKISSSGRITDSDITTIEAIVQALGLRTKDEEGIRRMYEEMYKNGNSSGAFKDGDVEEWYSILKRHLARRGQQVYGQEFMGRVLAEAFRVFGEDRPRVNEIMKKLLEKDARAGDFTVLNGLVRQMGLKTDEEMWAIINKLPDNETRQRATDAMRMREEIMNDTVR